MLAPSNPEYALTEEPEAKEDAEFFFQSGFGRILESFQEGFRGFE
jgi:hypothetical protein